MSGRGGFELLKANAPLLLDPASKFEGSKAQSRGFCRRRTWWFCGCNKGRSARSQGTLGPFVLCPSSASLSNLFHRLVIAQTAYKRCKEKHGDIRHRWSALFLPLPSLLQSNEWKASGRRHYTEPLQILKNNGWYHAKFY